MNVHLDDSYGQYLIGWLDTYELDLWNNLRRAPALPPPAATEILTRFIVLACQCQNIRNITLGRHGIWSLPKDWAIHHIEQIVESTLDLTDEWEYLRLLEGYEQLDRALLTRLVKLGFQSDNKEIQEAAKDFDYG